MGKVKHPNVAAKKKQKREFQKRKWKFLIALCVLVAFLWISGEILFGLVLDLGLTVSRIWAIVVIVGTCAFSLWKCPRS